MFLSLHQFCITGRLWASLGREVISLHNGIFIFMIHSLTCRDVRFLTAKEKITKPLKAEKEANNNVLLNLIIRSGGQ